MRILVTGFAPFGGETVNPSWEAVRRLPEMEGMARAELPVDWAEGPRLLQALIGERKPDTVLLCGQAGGRAKVCLERVAINLCEGKTPDNAGCIRMGEPVAPEGPAAYFSTADTGRMLAALEAAGIPAQYSFSAGTYLCNAVLYTALHTAAARGNGMKAVFIHLPYLPQQAEPSLPLETQAEALRLCVEAALL